MTSEDPASWTPVDGAARIVLRPLGNPLPLGFLALAAGALLVSGLQLGWLQAREGREVAMMLLVFVVPLQALAAILGFLARDVVAGTGMGILAATWACVGVVKLTGAPGAVSDPLGLLLLVSATALLIPATASLAGKVVPAAVLTCTALRLATTGVHEITEHAVWEDVAGIVGLVLFALAVYAAAAMAIEDARRTTVLPLGRRGRGADSVGGNLHDQLDRLEREAGVREQL